jgi:thiamine kinase-like enzyme
VELSGDKESEFIASCKKFYKNKTLERINLFYKNSPYTDDVAMINGIKYPSLGSILNEVDWEWLAKGISVRFHGDFHFENILWIEASEKFIFLDWRQDFAESLFVGDIYYDLAKLMHGLIISHEVIAKGLYSANWNGGHINFDFNRKEKLIECEKYFIDWLENNRYDIKKVRTLTALIYLNIAVLHHHPYSILLYALGKKMLFEEICPNANN